MILRQSDVNNVVCWSLRAAHWLRQCVAVAAVHYLSASQYHNTLPERHHWQSNLPIPHLAISATQQSSQYNECWSEQLATNLLSKPTWYFSSSQIQTPLCRGSTWNERPHSNSEYWPWKSTFSMLQPVLVLPAEWDSHSHSQKVLRWTHLNEVGVRRGGECELTCTTPSSCQPCRAAWPCPPPPGCSGSSWRTSGRSRGRRNTRIHRRELCTGKRLKHFLCIMWFIGKYSDPKEPLFLLYAQTQCKKFKCQQKDKNNKYTLRQKIQCIRLMEEGKKSSILPLLKVRSPEM